MWHARSFFVKMWPSNEFEFETSALDRNVMHGFLTLLNTLLQFDDDTPLLIPRAHLLEQGSQSCGPPNVCFALILKTYEISF